MIRFGFPHRVPIAALVLSLGAGSLTAGVFDVVKGKGTAKKPARNSVVRAQEPSPAPPAPLDVGEDPGYAAPALPAPQSPERSASSPAVDYAPQYSGFSDGSYCSPHACIGPRMPDGCCGHSQISSAKASRRLAGQSFYLDAFPLFGPRYGYYTTCWRRLPEDCRCPILLPPRKSTQVSEPSPESESQSPGDERVPGPPQVLNYR